MSWISRFSLHLLLVMALASLVHSAEPPPGNSLVGFQGYPEALHFTVAPRSGPLPNYPCSNCHQFRTPDPTPRPLKVEHPELDHGGGDLWCQSCHSLEQPDVLNNELGQAVAYENTYLVCGRCHGSQRKDWYFGAHGKRVANWQGERELYNCIRCHNPHQPVIQPREPQPPPSVRVGLERQQGTGHGLIPIWERHGEHADGDTK